MYKVAFLIVHIQFWYETLHMFIHKQTERKAGSAALDYIVLTCSTEIVVPGWTSHLESASQT